MSTDHTIKKSVRGYATEDPKIVIATWMKNHSNVNCTSINTVTNISVGHLPLLCSCKAKSATPLLLLKQTVMLQTVYH